MSTTSVLGPQTVQGEAQEHPSRFFWYAGIGFLVFVIVAFGAAAVEQPFRRERYTRPAIIVHILIMLGWLALFLAQSSLVRLGAIAQHRKNVWLGAFIVLVMAPQGIALRYQVGNVPAFIAETLWIVAFAVLFIASIRAATRGDFEAHKRLMMIGTLNLLGPAFARLGQILEWMQSPLVAFVLLVLMLTVPPFVYDLRARGRPHWASVAGAAFSVGMLAVIAAIGASPLADILRDHMSS